MLLREAAGKLHLFQEQALCTLELAALHAALTPGASPPWPATNNGGLAGTAHRQEPIAGSMGVNGSGGGGGGGGRQGGAGEAGALPVLGGGTAAGAAVDGYAAAGAAVDGYAAAAAAAAACGEVLGALCGGAPDLPPGLGLRLGVPHTSTSVNPGGAPHTTALQNAPSAGAGAGARFVPREYSYMVDYGEPPSPQGPAVGLAVGAVGPGGQLLDGMEAPQHLRRPQVRGDGREGLKSAEKGCGKRVMYLFLSEAIRSTQEVMVGRDGHADRLLAGVDGRWWMVAESKPEFLLLEANYT